MEEVILGGGYTCSVCGQYQRTSALCHHDNNLIPETWDYVDSDTNKTNMKQTAIEWIRELSKQREPDKFDWQQAKEIEQKNMNALDLIDEHQIIRETVGYEFLNDVELCDLPELMKFLKIVYNYKKLKTIENG